MAGDPMNPSPGEGKEIEARQREGREQEIPKPPQRYVSPFEGQSREEINEAIEIAAKWLRTGQKESSEKDISEEGAGIGHVYHPAPLKPEKDLPPIVLDMRGVEPPPPFRPRNPEETWVEYDHRKMQAAMDHYDREEKRLGRKLSDIQPEDPPPNPDGEPEGMGQGTLFEMEPPESCEDAARVPDEDEDEEESRDHLFGVFFEDHFVIQELIDAVKSALVRPGLAPTDIKALARLLLALQCLPEPLPGFSIEITLGRSFRNGESRFDFLSFDDARFEVGVEQFEIVDEETEGDSIRDTWFECWVGGYHERGGGSILWDWINTFSERLKESDLTLSIEDLSDDDVFDWDAEPDPALWDDAPSQ